MSEDPVLEALRALKEADQDREAGPQVEARLLQEIARSNVRRRAQRIWKLAGACGAVAATVALVLITAGRPQSEPVQRTVASPTLAQAYSRLLQSRLAQKRTVPAPTPAQAGPRPVEPAPASTPRPKPAIHHRTVPVREVATEFYPLLDVEPPFERGELVRVIVPAATMREVGLPVSQDHLSDPVQADVLVGQEGLPRAIRFVSFQR